MAEASREQSWGQGETVGENRLAFFISFLKFMVETSWSSRSTLKIVDQTVF